MRAATKRYIVFAAVGLLILAAAIAGTYVLCMRIKKGGEVESFQAGERATTSVQYFAMTGCPHCSSFDPVWNAVTGKIDASDASSSLVMKRWDVKTPEGHAAAKEAGVTAFPHVQKTKPDGSVEVFKDKRTEASLRSFCES